MTESVYIVKLYSDPSSPASKSCVQSKFPSLAEGCGTVLGSLGVLFLVFGGLGMAVEMEVNRFGGGLWAGVICIGTGISGCIASHHWYRAWACYLFMANSLASIAACIACTVVTAAAIQIKRDKLEASREGWMDQPYVVSYNEEGTFGNGMSIVAANVTMTAVLATGMAAWSLYCASGLVLEHEMRDPEREKKLAQGDLMSKVIKFLAGKFVDPEEEPNKMVKVESKFKSAGENTSYQPTFFQLPIRSSESSSSFTA